MMPTITPFLMMGTTNSLPALPGKGDNMRTYTIEQKMSGTGSIHDLASDLMDRDIKFPAGSKYAVVLAAYYGGKGYTTHRTEGAAIKQSNSMTNYSHNIMDTDGNLYGVNYDRLERF